jgi:hypothetical protein
LQNPFDTPELPVENTGRFWQRSYFDEFQKFMPELRRISNLSAVQPLIKESRAIGSRKLSGAKPNGTRQTSITVGIPIHA